jgi:ELWxxDGT repeat protein
MVLDINPGRASSHPSHLCECPGGIYFQVTSEAQGAELWKSDGTAAGTVQVKDIYAGSKGSQPSAMICYAGVVHFSADNGIARAELWKSDGSNAGTVRIKDIVPGSVGSSPQFLSLLSTVESNAVVTRVKPMALQAGIRTI